MSNGPDLWEFSKGRYYSLKRKLKGEHRNRYDMLEYNRLKGQRPVPTKEQYKARKMARAAVKKGYIKRQPCEICGDEKSHIHHHLGYLRPLDIMWLCQSCHQRKENNNEVALEFVRRANENNQKDGLRTEENRGD